MGTVALCKSQPLESGWREERAENAVGVRKGVVSLLLYALR